MNYCHPRKKNINRHLGCCYGDPRNTHILLQSVQELDTNLHIFSYFLHHFASGLFLEQQANGQPLTQIHIPPKAFITEAAHVFPVWSCTVARKTSTRNRIQSQHLECECILAVGLWHSRDIWYEGFSSHITLSPLQRFQNFSYGRVSGSETLWETADQKTVWQHCATKSQQIMAQRWWDCGTPQTTLRASGTKGSPNRENFATKPQRKI